MVKFTHTSIFLAITFIVTGCATTSGLQTYDIQRRWIQNRSRCWTECGSDQSTIIASNNTIYITFSNFTSISKPSKYLSFVFWGCSFIQLWAYPEITPPVTDSGNARALGYTIPDSIFLGAEKNVSIDLSASVTNCHPLILDKMLQLSAKMPDDACWL